MAKRKRRDFTEEDDFRLWPQALKDYLNRIGAEGRSFKRAMVKVYGKGHKYYIEKTLIKISETGEIFCNRKEHDPSPEEREDIKQAFKNLKFPTSTNGTLQGAEKHIASEGGDPDRFFILPDRRDGTVRMLQERVNFAGGGKGYIPWSFYSDGIWRRLEPDGDLPFWKPINRVEGLDRIMIHEGCKAARFVHDLTTNIDRKKELQKHPWGEQLVDYEHWGMIGGALAPHRTDYNELRRENTRQVIYACDNDYEGRSVLQGVSKYYGQAMTGVVFGDGFPPSWDMADDMPPKLYNGNRYNGPTLFELMEPATHATELVPPPGGKGRPMAVLLRAFKEEWIHCIKPEVFVHLGWPSQIWPKQEFNSKVRPYSDTDDTARLLLQDNSNKTAVLKYDPGKPPGMYGSLKGRFVNTHVGTTIKAEKGDISVFEEFMHKLCPIDVDRKELERWCATLIAKPGIKMHYGVLLISETQGVGKGTLGERILAPLIGEDNVSVPGEEEICGSTYNYWIAHKRLAVVHEIYAGHSAKAYNKLKSVITDKTITVQQKYLAPYEIENWLHIYANSNSKRAIQLSSDDRRWFVPKATEEKGTQAYWKMFHAWLMDEGGLGKIRWWAENFVKENTPVETGDSAPWSAAKNEVIEDSYSPGQSLISQMIDGIEAELEKPLETREKIANPSKFRSGIIEDNCFILDSDMVELIKIRQYQGRSDVKLEKPLTVRKVARQKGWMVNENKATTVPNWGLRASNTKLVCKNPAFVTETIKNLSQNGHKPLDILNFMNSKF